MTKSNGLKCGDKTNCDKPFKYTAEGGEEVTYYGNCKGLSLGACTFNGAECDSLAGFKCADWTQADGTNTVGCAADPSECGKPTVAGKYAVACSGLAGETCTGNTNCDAAVNRCTSQFNTTTYNFLNKTNVCMGKDKCNTKVNASDPTMNSTIYLCFNETGTKCDANTTCAKPNGDEGDVSCGYLAPGDGKYNMSGGMCVDAAMCNDAAKGVNGTTVPYFGGDAKLWCGSARTALAMGAAVVSAYLAM